MRNRLLQGNIPIWCVILLFAGCSGSGIEQPTYPVTGEIRLNGQPLKAATIVLHAVDKSKFKWSELPQGVTDEQGKFSLFTYASNDGAPAAEYKVGIVKYEAAVEEGSDQVKHDASSPMLPTKYADPETSGLTAKVEARATVLPTFELRSP